MYEPVLVLDSFIHWLALYVSTNELYFACSWIVNFRVKLWLCNIAMMYWENVDGIREVKQDVNGKI